MVDLKVKESLKSWIFWLLLNLIVAEFFLIIWGPICAIPSTLVAIYYLFYGPKQEKKIQEIEALLKYLEDLEKKNEDKK